MRIPNDKLRGAFIDSGLTASEVARRCGWFRKRSGGREGRAPDAGTVRLLLGLREITVKQTRTQNRYRRKRDGKLVVYRYAYDKPHTYRRRTLNQKDALKLCAALHLDPVDFGL